MKCKVKGKVIKSLSDTRWSARADATNALRCSYVDIKEALRDLSDSGIENATTQNEASSLVKKMDQLETAIMTVVWDCILTRFNAVNKSLQKQEIELCTAVELFDSLLEFINGIRHNFNNYEEVAKTLVPLPTYAADQQRIRQRKRQFDEIGIETEHLWQSPKDNFRVNAFFVVIDHLSNELKRRRQAYDDLHSRFNFLVNFSKLTNPQILEAATNFQLYYANDIEEGFANEFLHFTNYFVKEENKSPSNLLALIRSKCIKDTFPNVEVALRMYLTIPSSNAEGERSFSVLKRVKNQIRNSIGQQQLCDLSLMTIESDIVQHLSFDDVIADFAQRKSRRKAF